MKANRFLEKITDDLPAKIFCFIIALFLCLFYQLSLIDKKTLVVPLKVVQDGAVVRVSDVPSYVKVVVRSSSVSSNSIHDGDVSATLNLNNLSESGSYDIPVFLNLDKDLLVIDPLELKSKPEYITVKVEKKIKKAVRVETPIIGDVLHGYKISEINITPETVYITGPESIVNSTATVRTDTIDVTDIESKMSFKVQLHQTNKMLVYDAASEYETEIVLSALEMERDFINFKINSVNLSSEFQLESELPFISFRVSGAMPVLENYQLSASAVTVDFSEVTATGEYTLPVKIKLPSNLVVTEKTIDEVTVNVMQKPKEEEHAESLIL